MMDNSAQNEGGISPRPSVSMNPGSPRSSALHLQAMNRLVAASMDVNLSGDIQRDSLDTPESERQEADSDSSTSESERR